MAGKPVTIEAIIEGNLEQVREVKILFRPAGQDTYIEEEMYEYMGIYQYHIPAEYVKEVGLEYLIIAEMQGGGMAAFPEVDPYDVPIFLSAKKSSGAQPQVTQEQKQEQVQGGIPSNAIILSPEEGEIVAANELVIAVSLFNTPEVNLNSVKLSLDGQSILKVTDISEDLIVARPKNVLPGLHTVKLRMQNKFGDPYAPLIWNFTVVKTVAETQRMLNYSGRIDAKTNSEQIRGVTQNIHHVRAFARGAYDWLRFDSRAFVTSQEDPERQPRNRFRAGIQTSYFDLNLGDVNPRFNEFALNGKRVRGLEARLKLRYFNLHFITGETERKITGNISLIPDTTSEGMLEYQRSGYTYKRDIFAIRPYFGSGEHFQLGFSVLKAIDDTLSVERSIGGVADQDNVFIRLNEKPQDNIVVGSDMTIAIDNKRIVWQNDFELSYLNRDISEGAMSLKRLDTFFPGDSLQDSTLSLGGAFEIPLSNIPFDPKDFANIFVLNENISPLLPVVPDTNGVIGIREILNMPSTAFRSQFKLNYFNNYLVVRYNRIGPEFFSLGNPYLQNDIQGFNISDRIRLFKNKIFLTINYDERRDNLNQSKDATTTKSNFKAGFSLYPGEGLPTVNLNTMQYSRRNDLAALDTTFYLDAAGAVDSFSVRDNRESNMTMMQSVSLSHQLEFSNIKNNLNINYTTAERSDRIDDRIQGFQFNAMTSSALSVAVNSEFGFPLKTTFRFSSNTNKSSLTEEPYEFTSLTGQGRYNFLDNNLSTYLGYNFIQGKGQAKFTKNKIFAGGYFNFLEQHRISGRFSYTLLDDIDNDQKFNDYHAYFVYSFMF